MASPITKKALDRIAEQKKQIEEIKEIDSYISKYQQSKRFTFSSKNLELIKQALDCYATTLQLDISKREEAIECGSEDGNLSSQGEKEILQGCITLIGRAVEHAKGYIASNGIILDEEDKYSYAMSYPEIVNALFLWGTSHSGGTSTWAKCRELGVDPGESVEFAADFDEDEYMW